MKINKSIKFLTATFLPVFLIALFLTPVYQAQALTAGPSGPGTMATSAGTGSDVNWTSADNAKLSDNAYATVVLSKSPTSSNGSYYLKATNFGFSIPASATINGITASIEKKSSTVSCLKDLEVRIIKAGTIDTTQNKANASFWSTTEGSVSYGGTSDLWGLTWAASDINLSTFGFALYVENQASTGNPSCTASVDQMTLGINYTADVTAPTFAMQYYSDSTVTTSPLADNSRLKAGTYYVKISANEALSGAPTVSIAAEGTANDVTNGATILVSSNDYKYTRTISSDAAAEGSELENWSVTGTDTSANTATNANPTNEATKAAYTDTTAPTNQNTVFAASTSKQGGATVTVVSSGDATNAIWFAPSGTTIFVASATMTTAGGTATSILAPATAGAYRMFVLDAAGNISTQSTAILTVDNTSPTVTGVSSTLADGSYVNTSGTTIPITVTFSESVTVTGTPTLTLSTGSPTTTVVNYFSGSPGATLTFNYTIAANNYSADLDYAATTSLSAGAGTIQDAAGNTATLTLASPGAAGSLGANKAIAITHPVPTVTSIDPSSISRSLGGMTSLFTDMTVTGTNFDNSSEIYFNGGPVGTSFTNPTELFSSSNIPIGTSGIFPITIVNPTPGGGTSNSTNFIVIPRAPGTPDMTDATDLGSSSTDNLTSDTTPDFTMSCETGSTVTLYDDTTSKGTGSCAGGTVTITSFPLSEGTHASMNAKQTDSQGNASNTSISSFNLSITIDATVPNNAASLGWTTSSPSSVTSVTASWTKSASGDLANQKIQFYSDAVCGTTSGSLINLASTTTETYAFVGTDGNTYTYKMTSIDTAGNENISSCSSPMAISTVGPLDHFFVEAVGGGSISTQTAGSAFNIKITAQDASNITVTSFTGTVDITSAGTLSSGSGTTLSFSSGVLSSHSVTISNTGNFTITATKTGGTETGTSNAFDVNPGILHHFNIDTVSSPQTAGINFDLVMTAKDILDNTVTSFTGTVDLSTNAGTITPAVSGAFSSGARTESINVTESGTGKTITVTKTGGSEAGTSNSFDVVSGSPTLFLLNDNTDMDVGTRATYTVTRKDQFGNLSTVGNTTTYLYSSNTGSTDAFYDAAIDGNTITSVDITDTNSSADFWYYDDTAGTWTITASDNASVPDGATGIVDATDDIDVNIIPIIATQFVIETLVSAVPASDAEVGTTVTAKIKAVDGGSQLATSYNRSDNSLVLNSTGSSTASSGITFNITNGIGTVPLTDDIAEMITLSLTDNLPDVPPLALNTADFTFTPGPLDHFSFGPVASPQIAGQSFNVTITAKDAFGVGGAGNTVTSFVGTVDLDTTAGAITPTTSTAFAGGTILESVTVTETGTGNNITATRTGGSETGTSGNFTVHPGTLDHFVIEAAGGGSIGTQTAGTPFDIRITAYDANNNILDTGVNAFNDSAEITSNGTLSLGDGTSDDFDTGMLDPYSVSISNTGSFSITATNGAVSNTSNTFTVGSAPIVATKFIILDPSDVQVGGSTTVTIKAVDNSNNVQSTFQDDITLITSGSATGGGLVDIVNGVGTISISDAIAETINLSLLDVPPTTLDFSSTQDVIFSATPIVVISGGGQGPGYVAPGAGGVSVSGSTFPSGRITLFAFGKEKIPVKQNLASGTGSFNFKLDNLLTGFQFYGLLVSDKDGKLSQAKIYKLDPSHPDLFINDFITSPTLGLLRSNVTKGDFLSISGYANRDATLVFEIDGKIQENKVTASSEGVYKLLYNTALLPLGNHELRVKQILPSGSESEFSLTKAFSVTNISAPITDVNGDNKVDLHDASVFVSLWLNHESEQAKNKIDFNNDGKVDIQDFSIFVRNLKL